MIISKALTNFTNFINKFVWSPLGQNINKPEYEGELYIFDNVMYKEWCVSYWKNKTIVESFDYPYQDEIAQSWNSAKFLAQTKLNDLKNKYPKARSNA